MAGPLVLPPNQLDQLVRLLRALDLYRLLSHDMMVRLGVAGSREAVAQLAGFALRKKLVNRIDATLFEGVRRVPFLYWLTPKGAATLNLHDDLDGSDAAIGATRRFGRLGEIMHRIGIVELHLAARAWCHAEGIELDGFISDFEPGSRGRQKKTAFKWEGGGYAPDGLAWVRLPRSNTQRLLVIELERGGEAGDLYPFMSQKLPHMRAVAEGRYLERYLGLHAPPLFLIVLGSHATYRDGTKKPLHELALAKWPDKAAPVWDRFFVTSEEEAAADFGRGWHHPSGGPSRDLFPGPAPNSSATNSA